MPATGRRGVIKRSSIMELKHHVDLYQVVSDYVHLKKSGSGWKGLSPFKNEKTPSFFVYPDRGFFYCHSTSQGGDVFNFLEFKEGLSFIEAVEELADRFNFKLEHEERLGGGSGSESYVSSKRLRDLHAAAVDYYVKALRSGNQSASSAMDYWVKERGFSMEVADQHQIGFAPVDGGVFQSMLRQKGFNEEELESSGLFFPKGGSSRRLTPRFRGRLMIPICDLMGKTIAFTARKLDVTPSDDPAFEAKYVNSPKTLLFSKGDLLFGIHVARKVVSMDRPFVMVEGQLDAIRCWAEGFEEVVATQGTAITEVQLGKLKKYCPKLIMCLDGDSAGANAALKTLPLALATGLDLRFAMLPEGEDPDTYIRKHGAEAFASFLQQAMPGIPYFVARTFHPTDRSAAALNRATQQCFELIAASHSMIERSSMLDEIARIAGLDGVLLKTDFERFLRNRSNSGFNRQQAAEAVSTLEQIRKLSTIESDLFALAVLYPEVRQEMSKVDLSAMLQTDHPEGRLLVRICGELLENSQWCPLDESDHLIEEDSERNLLYQYLVKEADEPDPLLAFHRCRDAIVQRFDKKRLREIDRSLTGPEELDADTLTRLLHEKMQIQRRLAGGARSAEGWGRRGRKKENGPHC